MLFVGTNDDVNIIRYSTGDTPLLRAYRDGRECHAPQQ